MAHTIVIPVLNDSDPLLRKQVICQKCREPLPDLPGNVCPAYTLIELAIRTVRFCHGTELTCSEHEDALKALENARDAIAIWRRREAVTAVCETDAHHTEDDFEDFSATGA